MEEIFEKFSNGLNGNGMFRIWLGPVPVVFICRADAAKVMKYSMLLYHCKTLSLLKGQCPELPAQVYVLCRQFWRTARRSRNLQRATRGSRNGLGKDSLQGVIFSLLLLNSLQCSCLQQWRPLANQEEDANTGFSFLDPERLCAYIQQGIHYKNVVFYAVLSLCAPSMYSCSVWVYLIRRGERPQSCTEKGTNKFDFPLKFWI